MIRREHLLIRGATLLSMDPQIGERTGADIEIIDGAISRVGADLTAGPDGGGVTVVDGSSMIAMPGFADPHWHMWGTLLRGVIGDGKEHGWFARKGRLGPYFTPDDTYQGVLLAAAEGLAAGVTTVHDWAHNVLGPEHADADLRAHAELGTRVHYSYGAPSAHPSMPAEDMRRLMGDRGKGFDEPMDFADVARVKKEWESPAVTVGVNVRGPARSSPEVYRQEWAAARELGLPIAMHCAGTRAEVRRIHQVSELAAAGLLGPDMLLAHCLYLPERDRELVAEHGIPITMSPLSELRLAMGIPPLLETREAGIPVSLSLDTTAICAAADPFQAMRVALGLAAAGRQDPCAITPRDMLRIATLEGARALGLGEITGSITPGKRADLILIRTDDLNMAPAADPAVAVVHSAQPANVDTVIVDGRVVKRAGRLTVVDPAEVVAAAAGALRALCGRAGFEL